MGKGDEDYERWVKYLADAAVDVEVVGQGEGEECDVVVCRLKTEPLLLPDNVVAPCAKCFRLVQFRPHAPKRPAKWCDECTAKQIAKDGGDHQVTITEKTAADVAEYYRKRGMN